MTNKAVPLASIVSFDDVEEEQTRIFSRAFLDYAAQQRKEPSHRYVAIAIPAFPEDGAAPDGEQSPSWLRAATALLWASTLTITAAAMLLALAE